MQGHPYLLLVRHGQTDFNKERRFQGQLPVRLNDLGRDQAVRSAEALESQIRKLPSRHLEQCHFLTSDLARASETAEIIHKILKDKTGIPIELQATPMLREQHVGLLQGMTMEEFHEKHPERAQAYQEELKNNPYHVRPPGPRGESKMDVAARLKDLLSSTLILARQSSHDRVYIWCSHGWTINVLLELMSVYHGPPEGYIGNADVLRIESDLVEQACSELARQMGISLKWSLAEHVHVGERLQGVSFHKVV